MNRSQSYFVACESELLALEVVSQCIAEGFKAVASQNLNGQGYIVEYWK